MTRRSIPAAAGLVLFVIASFQLTFALNIVMQVFEIGWQKEVYVPAFGLLLALTGQMVMGYCAARGMSIAAGVCTWLVGCLGCAYGFHVDGASGQAIFVGVLQLVGGPLAFLFAATQLPATQTPMRRELGAVLLVTSVGHVVGSIWFVVYMLRMFAGSTSSWTSLAGIGLQVAVASTIAGFGFVAARRLLDGHPHAHKSLVIWKWVSIGLAAAMTLLTVISLWMTMRDLPRSYMISPVVRAAFGMLTPFAFERIGRDAAVPLEPREQASVPTSLAWVAMWFVPTFACAAVLTQSGVISDMLGPSVRTSISLVSACCVLAATSLLATSFTSLRGSPSARWLAQVTAALSVCAVAYLVYSSWTLDRYEMMATIPVGSVAEFAVAMIALAWFESRREQNLAPARVVS